MVSVCDHDGRLHDFTASRILISRGKDLPSQSAKIKMKIGSFGAPNVPKGQDVRTPLYSHHSSCPLATPRLDAAMRGWTWLCAFAKLHLHFNARPGTIQFLEFAWIESGVPWQSTCTVKCWTCSPGVVTVSVLLPIDPSGVHSLKVECLRLSAVFPLGSWHCLYQRLPILLRAAKPWFQIAWMVNTRGDSIGMGRRRLQPRQAHIFLYDAVIYLCLVPTSVHKCPVTIQI